MRKSVFHALLVGTCVTLGVLSACGKREETPQPAVGPTTGTGEDSSPKTPVLVGKTELCNVFRVYDAVTQRYIYFLEAVYGENLRCGGITTP